MAKSVASGPLETRVLLKGILQTGQGPYAPISPSGPELTRPYRLIFPPCLEQDQSPPLASFSSWHNDFPPPCLKYLNSKTLIRDFATLWRCHDLDLLLPPQMGKIEHRLLYEPFIITMTPV